MASALRGGVILAYAAPTPKNTICCPRSVHAPHACFASSIPRERAAYVALGLGDLSEQHQEREGAPVVGEVEPFGEGLFGLGHEPSAKIKIGEAQVPCASIRPNARRMVPMLFARPK